MTTPLNSSLFVFGMLALTQLASATTYEYSATNPTGGTGAGNVSSIFTSYDPLAQQLTWQATISGASSSLANGFWLVLSDGPNPKGIADEFPIFYLDASKSFDTSGNATGIAPTLSAYAYNGVNGFDSYATPGVTLLSSASGLNWNASDSLLATGSSATHTLGFTIDTALLNNTAAVGAAFTASSTPFNPTNWEGTGFGPQIGIWFHPYTTGGIYSTYNAAGSLTSLHVADQSWVDTAYTDTVAVVPEPGSAVLVSLVGIGLMLRRSRRGTV